MISLAFYRSTFVIVAQMATTKRGSQQINHGLVGDNKKRKIGRGRRFFNEEHLHAGQPSFLLPRALNSRLCCELCITGIHKRMIIEFW